MIHSNSIESYHDIKPELSGRRRDVYITLYKNSSKLTDREVKDLMGFPDMNSVRPRITELVNSGYVKEVGATKCPVTGKTVRQVMVDENLQEDQLSLL